MNLKDMLILLAKKGQLLASYKKQAKKDCPEWQEKYEYKTTLDSIKIICDDLENDIQVLIDHIGGLEINKLQ